VRAKRKLPPVKPARIRKGNHPSNAYAAEAKTALRHEDRKDWPFPARRADLSDEAQLGSSPSPAGQAEPTFVLRASDPLSGMLVRFWANAHEHDRPLQAANARALGDAMDAWREKHRGKAP
jgi:hypothetical protein